MREIKFRGKDCSGKWRYGAYIPTEFTQWQEPSIFDGHHRAEVDGETLGQYTGYNDSDGTEVYEGDILDFTSYGIDGGFNDHFCNVVKFYMGTWQIEADKEVTYNLAWLLTKDFFKAKVIGNIYDNPKLLEAKND